MRLIISLVRMIFYAGSAITAGAVFSVIIEWLGLAFGWWDSTHAKEMLVRELKWSQFLDFWIDPVPVLEHFIATVTNTSGWHFVGGVYLAAGIYTVELVILRFLIIVTAVPAVLIMWWVISIDGLFVRDRRRFTHARESGFIYHNAKALLTSFICLPMMLYMSSPVAIHPTFFVAGMVIPSGVLLWLFIGNFKKYL